LPTWLPTSLSAKCSTGGTKKNQFLEKKSCQQIFTNQLDISRNHF
jgi:hypothetical protein